MDDKSSENKVLDDVMSRGSQSANEVAGSTSHIDANGEASVGSQAQGTAEDRDSDNTSTILSENAFEQLSKDIIAALKTVYDPEIPSDIYELGLIYKVDVSENRDVEIDMTLTAPACPVAEEMPIWVENAVSSVAGVGTVKVNLVFDPPWDMSRMSDEARLALNMF